MCITYWLCVTCVCVCAADLRIRRQHSSDSMSSINSAASHSSMGSAKDADDKKKKKKSWVRLQHTHIMRLVHTRNDDYNEKALLKTRFVVWYTSPGKCSKAIKEKRIGHGVLKYITLIPLEDTFIQRKLEIWARAINPWWKLRLHDIEEPMI